MKLVLSVVWCGWLVIMMGILPVKMPGSLHRFRRLWVDHWHMILANSH